ncbi:hypothetical protein [Aurantiacibacter poecillastricola]|uniref:hypothetical protein n=1 Tax=Aurantiacibacter poecillastricola TaxID=3064385 RepID=UPI00273D570F|nr:hypothetical protein [Aurantiacibacter sp. 219JJ12-13]MDP5261197.1 hypothetical protein [Aurantiacibacter sp. 219JJ12-13]
MSTRLLAGLAAPALLLLTACGDDAEVAVEDDGREASGEVLEGSISDEMLPLDQVRSQPPLAVEADEDGDTEDESGPAQDTE